MNLVPAGSDVRALLKGYGFDLTGTLVLNGTYGSGATVVTGINTLSLEPLMMVSGVGMPGGQLVQSVDVVDPVNGQITLTNATTALGSPGLLTFTYFAAASDQWVASERDGFVLPWVTRVTRQVFTGVQTVTEYYDGTGSSVLALRRRPVQSLLSISYTNVDSNLYYLTPSAILLIGEEGLLKAKANFNESTYIPIFYRGDRNVKVTYQVGFNQVPVDAFKGITCLLAERVLAHQASKTGGGAAMSGQGYNKSFGDAGKYGNRRKELAQEGMACLRQYMTGAGG